jgi:hypothetical protein
MAKVRFFGNIFTPNIRAICTQTFINGKSGLQRAMLLGILARWTYYETGFRVFLMVHAPLPVTRLIYPPPQGALLRHSADKVERLSHTVLEMIISRSCAPERVCASGRCRRLASTAGGCSGRGALFRAPLNQVALTLFDAPLPPFTGFAAYYYPCGALMAVTLVAKQCVFMPTRHEGVAGPTKARGF